MTCKLTLAHIASDKLATAATANEHDLTIQNSLLKQFSLTKNSNLGDIVLVWKI